MKTRKPNASRPNPSADRHDPDVSEALERAAESLQSVADADQSLADADQTGSDADQTASAGDQVDSDADQHSSDRDQATADRERAAAGLESADVTAAYEAARHERESATFDRIETRADRGGSGRERDATAGQRDRTAEKRDRGSETRDREAEALGHVIGGPRDDLLRQLADLRAKAAAARAEARADRARAAAFRSAAAEERSRLEAELRSAHLDQLTGAYRREMGNLALEHGIDRARRSDQRFVIAFVDVDGLKALNDSEGHAAGDHILQVVVRAIRTRVRSFDPVIRYGGDEFVCGIGGTDVEEAQRRFERIRTAIRADTGAGVTVGFAALADGDTVDELTRRAEDAMLAVKARGRAAADGQAAD
jgi:diguanylate cyclase (GGDEF)-like protein